MIQQQALDKYCLVYFRDQQVHKFLVLRVDTQLHLYDLYVEKLTGKNPNSREWEINNHSLENLSWGGHCNGWAAKSILYGFFDKALLMDLGEEVRRKRGKSHNSAGILEALLEEDGGQNGK